MFRGSVKSSAYPLNSPVSPSLPSLVSPCAITFQLESTEVNMYRGSAYLEVSWDMMAHGDARYGKWRGNKRVEWVASTLHTTSEHGVSSITTADAHTSAASSRLNWRPPADLNGLVRFAERRNLVSARVPSHFNWPLPVAAWCHTVIHGRGSEKETGECSG